MEARKGVGEERDRRTSENCNSRHFSWLMKSCMPNPRDPLSPIPYTSSSHRKTILSVRQGTTTTPTTIASLPDDLILEILSRLESLASSSSVCRHWSRLLDSPSFLALRRSRSLLHPTFFALSSSASSDDAAGPPPVCSSLHLQSPFPSSPSWKISPILLPPHHDDDTTLIILLRNLFSHARTVSILRKIYLIGREATAELDPWSLVARLLPAPLVPRKKFAAAAVGGKIYAAGGSARSSSVEEFDPATNSWRVVTDAPRKRYGCLGVGMDGIFYVIGGLKIGPTPSASVDFPRAIAAVEPPQMYASSMDLYDVEGGSWLRSRAVPGGGCVVAACGAMGYVYLLTSHAVELSFWRFSIRRKGGDSSGDHDGGAGVSSNCGPGGEWCRMKSPPLPAQMRVDGMVRFGCAAVGDKVVLVQMMSCGEDLLLRRSGRSTVRRGAYKGAIVMVFDCVGEEWIRGPDLPEGMQRATCACVEC